MSPRSALAPAPAPTREDPEAPTLHVFCYRPAGRVCAAFEARLRQVLAELCPAARLVFASAVSAHPPAGVYLSPVLPTVIGLVAGHLRVQAIGELPRWELRALVRGALQTSGAG